MKLTQWGRLDPKLSASQEGDWLDALFALLLLDVILVTAQTIWSGTRMDCGEQLGDDDVNPGDSGLNQPMAV